MALASEPWSQPVSSEIINEARKGKLYIPLLPGELPNGWLPKVRDMRVLCLAGGGGQQAPVLAAAGAEVVVFDASEEQLALDEQVAKRENLELKTMLGDMSDLSVFADESFDIIFHPVSNLYVPDVCCIWNECFRILRSSGRLLSSFYNPTTFVFERNAQLEHQHLLRPRYNLPYSDIDDLDADTITNKKYRGEAFVFGHTLNDQIGGQLNAGFKLIGFKEAMSPNPRFLIEKYVPSFIATCALKIAHEVS
ncbi:class I SAM-dependent methyltransferase [Enterobacter asburiae]